jgi:hypothetical protein
MRGIDLAPLVVTTRQLLIAGPPAWRNLVAGVRPESAPIENMT